MASPAGILDDPVVKFRDLNGVRVISAGEVERVPESVVGFDRVLSDDVVRRVAVIAGGHRMVARFHPGIVLRPHHVAVRTSGGVVGQVRVPLGVDEGLGAKADGGSQDHSCNQTDCDRALHGIAPSGRIRRIRLGISVAKACGNDLRTADREADWFNLARELGEPTGRLPMGSGSGPAGRANGFAPRAFP